jgi:hypothetical protein
MSIVAALRMFMAVVVLMAMVFSAPIVPDQTIYALPHAKHTLMASALKISAPSNGSHDCGGSAFNTCCQISSVSCCAVAVPVQSQLIASGADREVHRSYVGIRMNGIPPDSPRRPPKASA